MNKEEPLKPGEKGFTIFLLTFGVFALYNSLNLFLKDPRIISYGTFPLILSVLLIVFNSYVLLNCKKKKIDIKDGQSKKTLNVLEYLLPLKVLRLLAFMILYCIALFIGIGFELSTSVFLLISIHFFCKTSLKKKLIYTAITMGSILIVFKYVFKILLP